MAKDPAFLFYPGDWLGGTMGMTFEEKGAYFEMLLYQFNNGKFTKAQAKEVLSICSASVFEKVMKKFDTDGTFYWKQKLANEIERRKKFTDSRANNAKGLKSTKKQKKEGKAYAKHMETETLTGNEDEILNEYKNWSLEIIDGNDHLFQQSYMSEQFVLTPQKFAYWVNDHYDLVCRYPKMRPPTQNAFRNSVLKHLRENKDRITNGTGTNGKAKGNHAASLAEDFARRHGNGNPKG